MSDLVSALRREGKRKRDNMRANGIGHPYVVMVETEAAERIEALEAERDDMHTALTLLRMAARQCGFNLRPYGDWVKIRKVDWEKVIVTLREQEGGE